MRPLRFALALPLIAACATAPRAEAPSAPRATIENRPVRGTDRFRVVTDGFEQEVAVEGVDAADLPLGRDVLEAVVVALGNDEPAPGMRLDLHLGSALVPVKLISAAGKDLLVVDAPPPAGNVRPDRALATAAFARAWTAWDGGDVPAARRQLLESIRLFPGDPLRSGAELDQPPGTNQENHLAYALLAVIAEGAEQERYTIAALDRSPRYLAAQLGAWPAGLIESRHETLDADARAIVDENLRLGAEAQPVGGAVEFPSPIVDADGSHSKAILPAPFLALYYRDPVAKELREGPLVGLAVEAFERLRADPVELLLATREIRSIYLRADLFAPPPPVDAKRPWAHMLSALLADVARKSAAGLTPLEIAATLGAQAEPETLAFAHAKLREQREREAAWYNEALQSIGR